jgi:hypothetical protein
VEDSLRRAILRPEELELRRSNASLRIIILAGVADLAGAVVLLSTSELAGREANERARPAL